MGDIDNIKRVAKYRGKWDARISRECWKEKYIDCRVAADWCNVLAHTYLAYYFGETDGRAYNKYPEAYKKIWEFEKKTAEEFETLLNELMPIE